MSDTTAELAPIANDQVPYHPYERQDPLLEVADDLDVFVTAYSPLAQGKVGRDPVLREMMRAVPSSPDSAGAHAGHDISTAPGEAAAQAAMEFVLLLLSDPQIESRIHADPEMHRLWTDPAVQRCLATMRSLEAAGRPLPPTCPATTPAPRNER